MCKVSVIIPVYNKAKYLYECLDSIINQSLRDIEIICIDDGSTDESKIIMERIKRKDSRLIIIEQKNLGAGAARNRGLKLAKGQFLVFLDSDDYFEQDMLEIVYKKAMAEAADICIFGGNAFSVENNEYVYRERKHWVNKKYLTNLSEGLYLVDRHRFLCTNAASWNKIFKREFIEKEKLQFQEISWANDVYFTFMALALAERAIAIDKVLLHYRVGNKENLQSKTYKNPICFCKAFNKVKCELESRAAFDNVEYDFINVFLNHCVYHLNVLRDNKEAYIFLLNEVRRKYICENGLIGKPKEYFENKRNYDIYVQEVLNVDLISYKQIIKNLKNDVKRRNEREKKIRKSYSFRIGKVITFLPRKIKRLWSRK